MDVREHKIDRFCEQIRLPPELFVENLLAERLIHNPPVMKAKPNVKAYEYIDDMYSDELNVLLAACNFLAAQLAAQPEIRCYLRERYFEMVTVSTIPTEKGSRELDVFHRSYRVKRLKAVPRDRFVDDMWLDIEACERSELIRV